MAAQNSVKKGTVRFIIFKERETWFGVALEFGIVIDADSSEDAYTQLQDATHSYLESFRDGSIRESEAEPLLNKTAEPEYEELWNRYHARQPIPSPITIRSVGELAVA